MSTNIEIEAKVLLSKEDFEKVLSFLSTETCKRITQTNHYIDSEDEILRTYGFGLRIREKDDFTLTLKSPLAEGTLEKNQTITWKQYENLLHRHEFPHGDIKDFLEMLGIDVSQLRILTSLTTVRIVAGFLDDEVVLDKNSSDDTVDYEIEAESTSIQLAEDTLKKLCDLAQVPFTPNKLSKHARAMNALRRK